MDDLSRCCCQNSECPDYGKRGEENLSVCGRYGSNQQWRMLRCRTCKARFSERKGTPLFGSALPTETVRSILEHIAEGCGVRETGRLVGVHRDTVMRYSRLAGTYFTMYTYNFCWPVRTLRQQGPDGQWLPRTPAMAAGLTDHVWPLGEWLTFSTVQRE